MKKVIVTLKPADITKETEVDRAERIRYANAMRTRVIPNKKKLTRNQQKRQDERLGS